MIAQKKFYDNFRITKDKGEKSWNQKALLSQEGQNEAGAVSGIMVWFG